MVPAIMLMFSSALHGQADHVMAPGKGTGHYRALRPGGGGANLNVLRSEHHGQGPGGRGALALDPSQHRAHPTVRPGLGVEHVVLAQEAGHEFRGRIVVEVLGRPGLEAQHVAAVR